MSFWGDFSNISEHQKTFTPSSGYDGCARLHESRFAAKKKDGGFYVLVSSI